ncbi:fimbrial biogenesis chaperone [Type-D symbiont of Plautia stali]|uniref:fimbrial biogenesis chaperone n=1 Tax=Type-D symbiont of Plautia stali TaxID=1560356 RepID=UPI00073E1692|nr:molecular chaperone [Type-D symbiont of Plautia stali]
MKKLIVIALLALQSCVSHAASSVLVWPIFQVIEADQHGSALWLENRGSQPVRLQIRLLSWQQQDYRDRYADQSDVIASPPFATVPPQQRQLVRLIRTGPAPVEGEKAYRIILDEIPDANVPVVKNSAGLRLQMRYVLPLFLDSQGVWTQTRSDIRRDPASASQPKLSWQVITVQGKTLLRIRNTGKVHARLSQVFWGRDADINKASFTLAKGFLGYVLAGQSMQFPLPPGKTVPMGISLYTKLTDNGPAVAISQ